MRHAPSVTAVNVSSSNVENVVYAPMNPIGIRYRQFGCTTSRSASSAVTKPMIRQPDTLTTKVPYGNPTGTRAWMTAATWYRAIAPRAPPTAIMTYRLMRLLGNGTHVSPEKRTASVPENGQRKLSGLERRRDDFDELLRIDRLHDVLLEAGGNGPLAIGGARIGRQRDGRHRVAVQRPNAMEQRVAVFVGQADIDDQHVGPDGGHALDRLGRRRGAGDVGAGALQHPHNQLARIGVVLDDENRAPAEQRRHVEVADRHCGRGCRLDRPIAGRQPDREGGAAALTGTRRRHRPAMQLHDVPDDGEAETEAAVGAGQRRVGLPESIEDERQHVAMNADTAVGDLEFDRLTGAVQTQPDRSARAGELHGVGEHVPERLLNAVRIGHDRREPVFEG